MRGERERERDTPRLMKEREKETDRESERERKSREWHRDREMEKECNKLILIKRQF